MTPARAQNRKKRKRSILVSSCRFRVVPGPLIFACSLILGGLFEISQGTNQKRAPKKRAKTLRNEHKMMPARGPQTDFWAIQMGIWESNLKTGSSSASSSASSSSISSSELSSSSSGANCCEVVFIWEGAAWDAALTLSAGGLNLPQHAHVPKHYVYRVGDAQEPPRDRGGWDRGRSAEHHTSIQTSNY